MKPEPLTKKKIKEEVLNRIKSKYDKSIYEPILFFDGSDVIIDELIEIIKQRVEWLLKEIEKEIDRIEINKSNAPWDYRIANLFSKEVDGFIKGLKFAKSLIKKAFEGVEK